MSDPKTQESYAPGDVVYEEHGQRHQYVAAVPGAHVVRPLYFGEEEEFRGEPVILRTVYREAPVAAYDERVAERQRHIEELIARRDSFQSEVATAREERRRMVELMKQEPALRRIEDFLAGKITHFLVDDYGTFAVKTFEDAMKQEDRHDRQLRLLSLYGDTKGDLHWRINRYRDGSGGETIAWPFTSEEDATAFAVKMIADALASADTAKQYETGKWIERADMFGVEVPAALRLWQKERGVAAIKSQLADLAARRAKIADGAVALLGPEWEQQVTGQNAAMADRPEES